MNITYSTLSDQGERKVNEDCLGVVNMKEGIGFVLCDGLGGHGNGDVASAFVVEKMQEALKDSFSLEAGIMYAQNHLIEKQIQEQAKNSMKTTVTALVISDGKARFAHVGDSRIYYFEKSKYIQRSQDHSMPQLLVKCGEIRDKDIRHHEDRSRLLRVMGTEWENPKYEVVENIPVTEHTSFLLCSDGFWELIDERHMCKTLKKAKTPEEWLQNMRQIVLKNGRGTNMDNYSAIAVFIR